MSLAERWSKTHAYIKYIFLPNTFRVSTWLALGAVFQLVSLLCLPRRLSALVPILLILQRIFKAFRDSHHIYTRVFTDVRRGRWTTTIPSLREDGQESGVVIFVLGARVNHPRGRKPARAIEIAGFFRLMWKEAEKNRIKWGYLGRTPMLTSCEDEEGATFVWLSYWRDIKGLHEFSKCAAHRTGQEAYQRPNEYPHLGIMHELYFARKDSTETLYHNFPPFGMGTTQIIVDEDGGKSLKDPLVPDAVSWSNMFERMGRKQLSRTRL